MQKTLSSLLTILFILNAVAAKAQKFIWARPENSSVSYNYGDNYFCNVLADDNGNSYCGGIFADTLGANASVLYNPAIYLAKYNSTGKLVWGISDTSSNDCEIISICKNKLGYIYVLGQFEGAHAFGNITIDGDVGIFSYFIMKCDTAGNIYWATSYNNSYNNGLGRYDITLNSIACDSKDSAYIQGYASGNYYVNGIPAGTAGLFFSKLSPLDGFAARTTTIACNATLHSNAITTDYNDNLIISGTFGRQYLALPAVSCVFTPQDSLVTDSLTLNNGYIAKYNAAGTYLWSQKMGTTGSCYINGVSCDSSNNIYMADQESDSVDWNLKGYIKKINPAGAQLWQKECNCGTEAITSSKKDVYATLSFADTLQYANVNVVQQGSYNVVVKLDPASGNGIWAASPVDDVTSSISATNIGTVLYKGISYGGTKYKIGKDDLYSGSPETIFLALIGDSTFSPANANTISGNIYNDTSLNCLKDPGETGLNNFSVIAQPGPYFGVADTLGNYSIKVPAGTFNVQQLLPFGHHVLDTQNCKAGGYSVSFTGTNQVSPNNDFGNVYQPCPLLKVIASGGGYFYGAPTSGVQYTVCNYGATVARNTVLMIRYSGSVIRPVSSSIPWSSYNVSDSSLTFNLGDFPPDSCLVIGVTDTINTINSWGGFPFSVRLTPVNSCYPSDSVYNSANFIYQEEYIVGVPAPAHMPDNIKLFPNPTKSTITLTGIPGNSSIEVFSIMGQKIFAADNCNQAINIDLSQQAPGLYFITIFNGQETICKKAIKY